MLRYATTWLMSRPTAPFAPLPSPPCACAVRRRNVSAFFCCSSSSCFSRLQQITQSPPGSVPCKYKRTRVPTSYITQILQLYRWSITTVPSMHGKSNRVNCLGYHVSILLEAFQAARLSIHQKHHKLFPTPSQSTHILEPSNRPTNHMHCYGPSSSAPRPLVWRNCTLKPSGDDFHTQSPIETSCCCYYSLLLASANGLPVNVP